MRFLSHIPALIHAHATRLPVTEVKAAIWNSFCTLLQSELISVVTLTNKVVAILSPTFGVSLAFPLVASVGTLAITTFTESIQNNDILKLMP